MFNKIKYFITQSWLLIVASFLFGLLLAVTDYAWGPRIRENQVKKFRDKVKVVLPESATFDPEGVKIELEKTDGKKEEVVVYKALSAGGAPAGWAFEAQGSGFADKIILVIAVNGDFSKIAGYGVLSSNETPGYGDKIKNEFFKLQFNGAPAGELRLSKTGDPGLIDDEIVAISGATVTSSAMVDIFNNYVIEVKEALEKEGVL